MLIADKCAGRGTGDGWLALSLLIGSRAGLLVTYLRFASTKGSFSVGLRGGGGGVRAGIRMLQSMTATFTLRVGRVHGDQDRENKIIAICTR